MQRSVLRRIGGILNRGLRRFGYEMCPSVPEARDLEFARSIGIRTIIDVGANKGQFAQRALRAFPSALVYSFEPLSGPALELRKLAGREPRLRVFNSALGDHEGTACIEVNAFSPASSLLRLRSLAKDAFPYVREAGVEEVSITTLDRWTAARELPGPTLVKIDVQGYEDRVIRGGRRFLSKTEALIVEVSYVALYENQPLFDEVYCAVRDLQFRCVGVTAPIWSPTGQLLQGDALFLR